MPPKVVGPYRVQETLGTGGVGTVYRAVDRRTGEPVALKLLSTGPALDPRAARRLAREFETLAELSHPNVVRVFDTGVHQGYPYLAMELVEGLTLRHYLALNGRDGGSSGNGSLHRPRAPERGLREMHSSSATTSEDHHAPFSLSAFAEESPSEEASAYSSGPESVRALADAADEPDTGSLGNFDLPYPLPSHKTDDAATSGPRPLVDVDLTALNRPERIGRLKDAMLQLCQALAYIHGHGLIHRDLKPSNVMVDEDGMVKLMDFGLAKFLADDSAVTADGRLVGTFRYMSPEQILGEKIDCRTDLYSLGVILYELLSGRPPFDAKSPYELWQKVLETRPPPLSTLNAKGDPQLVRIAHRLIRKEPDERFQTAEEIFEALSE
jgi:serine/threonine protein kinase